MGATTGLVGVTDEELAIGTYNSVLSYVKPIMEHLQVLFDENFQYVLVLEDDFDVNAKNVVAVRVLPAEITGGRSRQTKEMFLEKHQKRFHDLQNKNILRLGLKSQKCWNLDSNPGCCTTAVTAGATARLTTGWLTNSQAKVSRLG